MKTETREHRDFVIERVEIRAGDGDDKAPILSGVVNTYGKLSEDLGGFREKFESGAFTKSISGRDIVALSQHDSRSPLGRTKSGTLTLRDSKSSLEFELPLPDTSAGRDIAVLAKRGDLGGMSFGFRATIDEWDETQDPPIRTVREAELYEISVVTSPAYPDTSVAVRSLESRQAERESVLAEKVADEQIRERLREAEASA